MEKCNDRYRIRINGSVHINCAPYYEFDGTLTYDTNPPDDTLSGKTYMANFDFTFKVLDLEEEFIFQRAMQVDIRKYYDEKLMLKEASFLAFKKYCYDWFHSFGYVTDPEKSAGRELSIVSLANRHTMDKLWKKTFLFECDWETLILDGNEVLYRVREDGFYQPEEWGGTVSIDETELNSEEDNSVFLTYKNDPRNILISHDIHMKNIHLLSDYIEALRMLPSFLKKYYSEAEQREEAIHRLRLLGVPEEEIEDFRSRGIIPVIEDDSNGVRRGEDCRFYGEFYLNNNDATVKPKLFDELNGKLPYLIFDSCGILSMSAILYVEDLREDTISCRAEFDGKTDELILSALGASGDYGSALFFYNCSEYGAVVVRLSEDGPIRVG